MTTALPEQHHHPLRLHGYRVLVVLVALLAALAVGAAFELAHDDPQTANQSPGVSISLTHQHLQGSGHTEPPVKYYGTTSGGHVVFSE